MSVMQARETKNQSGQKEPSILNRNALQQPVNGSSSPVRREQVLQASSSNLEMGAVLTVEEAQKKYKTFKADKAKDFNKNRNYTVKSIKKIQALVNVTQSGIFDDETVCGIVAWQDEKNLVADGMFGNGALKKAISEKAIAEKDVEDKAGFALETVGNEGTGNWEDVEDHMDTSKPYTVMPGEKKVDKGKFQVGGEGSGGAIYSYEKSHGMCAAGAKFLMQKAGFNYEGGDAKDMVPKMTGAYGYVETANFSRTKGKGSYSEEEGDVALTLPDDHPWQAGDIKSYDKDNKEHASRIGTYGHMSLYLGKTWISDFKQNSMFVYEKRLAATQRDASKKAEVSNSETVHIYRKASSKPATKEETKTATAPKGESAVKDPVSTEKSETTKKQAEPAPAVPAKTEQSSPSPKPNPKLSAEAQDETVLMAMNIYAEARGQSDEGMSAVGQVVYNRVHAVSAGSKQPLTWWGSGIKGVICQPSQFSWLNSRTSDEYKNAVKASETQKWESSYRIAKLTIGGGGIANISKGNYVADSYLNRGTSTDKSWEDDKKFVTKIGSHTFYSLYNLSLPGGLKTQTQSQATVANTVETTNAPSTQNSQFPDIDVEAAIKYNRSYGYSSGLWKHIQEAVGLKGGDVDGIVGSTTSKHIAKWQKDHGFTGGGVDGICGSKTLTAMGLKAPISDKKQEDVSISESGNSSEILTQKEIRSGKTAFGTVDQAGKNQVMVTPAYPVYYGKSSTRFQVHKLIANRVSSIFSEVKSTYSEKEIEELGLNKTSGSYNKRKTTGGSSWSIHSWGVAIDIDGARNPFKSNNKEPLATEKAKKFWEIVEKNGGHSMGRKFGYDWMHFQFAKY